MTATLVLQSLDIATKRNGAPVTTSAIIKQMGLDLVRDREAVHSALRELRKSGNVASRDIGWDDLWSPTESA